MVTALTGSRSDILGASAANTFTRVLVAAQQRAAERTSQLQQRYEGALNLKQAELSKAVGVKSELTIARQNVEKGVEAAQEIRDTLRLTRVYLEKLKEAATSGGDPQQVAADQKYYRDLFDQRLGTVNSTADKFIRGFTLIGDPLGPNYQAGTVEYEQANGNFRTLQGAVLGTPYHINDDTGTVWQGTPDTQSLTERESFDGEGTGNSTSTINGVRLDSKLDNGDGTYSVTFTANYNAATPVTRTGTLVRGGGGVMPAWFYGGLTDPAEIDAAINDVRAAETKALVQQSTMVGYAAGIKSQGGRIEERLADIRKGLTDTLKEQQDVAARQQESAQAEIRAVQLSLQNARNQANGYATVLQALAKSPFNVRQDV